MKPVLDPPDLGSPDIRLIAVDMDGSLLDDDKRIDPSFWPLLDQLHDRGVALCPASGRQYATLRDQFGRDDLVYIAENGAFVVHEGREIASEPLGSLHATHALDAVYAGGHDTGVVLCGKRSAYVERTDEAFLEQVRPYYHLLQTVPDLRAVDDEVLKVAVYDFESSTRTAAELAGIDGVIVSGPHWVDVMSPSADKGVALKQVQDAWGIGPEQTMAFGDFHNDLGMLAAAHYSVAMDNAHPDVRGAARFVAPANSRNGVVRTIVAALGLSLHSG